MPPLRPWQYAVFLSWRWALLHNTDPPKALEGLSLSKQVREDAQIEWEEWGRDYLPKDGLEGKTVLDVGAGEGETAAFFFSHGASKVIAIEPDPEKFRRLKANIRSQGWNVEAIREEFNQYHIWEHVRDFTKIDAEGAESILLGEPSLAFPLVMEVHTDALRRTFKTRFPALKWRRRNWWRDLWIARTP